MIFDNSGEKCSYMNMKKIRMKQQLFQMSMYLENINPQIQNKFQKLMDIRYLQQCSLQKVLYKLQNQLLFKWTVFKSFRNTNVQLVHSNNNDISIANMNSQLQLSQQAQQQETSSLFKNQLYQEQVNSKIVNKKEIFIIYIWLRIDSIIFRQRIDLIWFIKISDIHLKFH
ncbi:unnamed protein product [Paramecium pentaurelia]|uniref:Uncharacterized protein n=1 Tax=Paramecium pentaurelia TaxID=43138 RepID=A0A8S1WRE9_9CILI|nr:unnamed protein product [Paramecium pentaurelia]